MISSILKHLKVMNAALVRFLFRLKMIDPKIEFITILGWLLFFPDKLSQFYFLGTAFFVSLFAIRYIYFLKTIGSSVYSSLLMGVNFIFIVSAFFSNVYYPSLLFICDFLLMSLYFILFSDDFKKEKNIFRVLLVLISLFSLTMVLRHIVPFLNHNRVFFISTIHEGVICGIGVLIGLYYILERFSPLLAGLLLINVGGVFVSKSKAAFIGIILFSLVLTGSAIVSRIAKEKRLRFFAITSGILALFILITFTVPNPVKSSFLYSIKKDRYSTNRLDIWNMSLSMFKDHPVAGVGLDNFSEVCLQYNFKQTRGPANYFKLPNNTHNDYFQLIAETGIPGILVIAALLFLIAKKLFFPFSPFFDITKILLLYLLFQAFLFNILFNSFFIFLLLFLLKDFFERKVIFKSFSLYLKHFLSSLLVFVFIFGYLFPWISDSFVRQSKETRNPMEVFSLLNKAEIITPLDPQVHYLKALSLYSYFLNSSNLDAFYEAIYQLRKVQKLNKYFIDAYTLESRLYIELVKKNMRYPELKEEITAPLRKAEFYSPFNPFIKMVKAGVFLDFNQRDQAKNEALKALELEPEYVSALMFLQKNFGYFGDDRAFKERIAGIQEKAKRINPVPGHYLYNLYQIPGN